MLYNLMMGFPSPHKREEKQRKSSQKRLNYCFWLGFLLRSLVPLWVESWGGLKWGLLIWVFVFKQHGFQMEHGFSAVEMVQRQPPPPSAINGHL